MKCIVENCGAKVFVPMRQLCRLHYQRWWNGKPMHKPVRDEVAIFHSRVARGSPDDCWLWTAGKDWDGYGIFHYQGKTRRANRLALQFSGVVLGKKDFVCHRCDNPPCCNPNHLFIGTGLDNSLDMIRKGRWHGSPTTKIPNSQAIEIKASFKGEYGEIRRLARQYGVSSCTISNIVHGRRSMVPSKSDTKAQTK